MNDFDMPEDLSPDGQHAYRVIRARLNAFKDLNTGGCKAFYSPFEWAARGEQSGLKSVLIVVYDGGDLRGHFNMDAAYEGHCMLVDFLRENGRSTSGLNGYESIEKMQEALGEAGFFFEECNNWYGAVYKR